MLDHVVGRKQTPRFLRVYSCLAQVAMTSPKFLPSRFRAITSLPVRGKPEDIMDATEKCLEDMGTIIERNPYTIRARVVSMIEEVTVKSRLIVDGDDMFVETTRRRGDGVLFVDVWLAIEAALWDFRPPPADLPEAGFSIYAAWSRDDMQLFSDRHAELSVQARKGTLDKSALRGHVLQIPSSIREARLNIAKSATNVCDQIDEILCEAAAYHASCAARC